MCFQISLKNWHIENKYLFQYYLVTHKTNVATPLIRTLCLVTNGDLISKFPLYTFLYILNPLSPPSAFHVA